MRRITLFVALLIAAATAAAFAARGNGAATSKPDAAPAVPSALAADLATARLATAKYATSLERAKRDGYTIITKMIPDMGYHYLNPKISGFDVRRPSILVYVKTRRGLAARRL